MHRNSFFDQIQAAMIASLLEHFADHHENVKFIEVGAYDGQTFSYVYRFATQRNWRGLCIEPAPHAFEQLKQNYISHPFVVPVNCAVGTQEGNLPFYVVRADDTNVPWAGMLSSLDKSIILSQRNYFPHIESSIQEITVPVKSLHSIAAEYNLQSIDFLKIDAEGRDIDVLKSARLEKLLPTLVLFEHKLTAVSALLDIDKIMLDLDYKRICMWADTVYVRGKFSEDECVLRLIENAPAVFPPGHDPEWGNGNWGSEFVSPRKKWSFFN